MVTGYGKKVNVALLLSLSVKTNQDVLKAKSTEQNLDICYKLTRVQN